MIHLRTSFSQRPILIPRIPNMPMWQYLEDVVAPAADLKVRDGTVYEWIVHERDLRFPVFTRKNKHMRMGDVIPDDSRLFVTSGRPEPMYGNACFADLIYVPMESNTLDMFSKMMGMVSVLLLAMMLLAEYVKLPPEDYNRWLRPYQVLFETNTTNHSFVTDISNWFMVISLYFIVRWMVTKMSAWF